MGIFFMGKRVLPYFAGAKLGACHDGAEVNGEPEPEPNILGIVLVAEGGGSGTWQRINKDFDAITTTTADFDAHPVYAGVVDEVIDGQYMVKVPKFWVKTEFIPRGNYAGKRYWMVSDRPAGGFVVHPAFMRAGVEIDHFWVGKYQGTDDGGTKLGSKPGVIPIVSLSFPTLQARAAARNVNGVTGFALWNIYQLAAIQILTLIEIGGSNSKALVAPGYQTGSFGAKVNTDASQNLSAAWRGITGLWGNIWEMVDGVQTDASRKYKIWDKQGNQTYVTTDQVAPASTSEGYAIVSMSCVSGSDYDLSQVFVPSTLTGSDSSGTYGNDRFWSGTNAVAYHGGQSCIGSRVGLFTFCVEDDPQKNHAVIGARLAKEPADEATP